MASTQVVRAPAVHAPSVLVQWGQKYFYLFMSLLIAVIVIYGFSHTVDHGLIHAKPPRPLLLWIHAFLFCGWVCFYILQSALVRIRKIKVHRTLGWVGAALGCSMIVVGFRVSVVMMRFQVTQLHRSEARVGAFLAIPFWDITAFTVCLGLALLWRKMPERHRRLMLLASCVLTAAAFGRIDILDSIPVLNFYAGVDGLILIGVLRDLAISRRIHAVYLSALPLLVAGQAAVIQILLHKPALWLRFADRLLN